jgi:hypothetical protein
MSWEWIARQKTNLMYVYTHLWPTHTHVSNGRRVHVWPLIPVVIAAVCENDFLNPWPTTTTTMGLFYFYRLFDCPAQRVYERWMRAWAGMKGQFRNTNTVPSGPSRPVFIHSDDDDDDEIKNDIYPEFPYPRLDAAAAPFHFVIPVDRVFFYRSYAFSKSNPPIRNKVCARETFVFRPLEISTCYIPIIFRTPSNK